jgi:lipopolysaccharide/colanic/teichoic acid biosynthesis glycosyltransferase
MSSQHDKPSRVIDEDLFKEALIRERKRSDRSNQPFALLLIDVPDRLGADSSSIGENVIEALAAVTRETDVLGWLTWHAVIGVILAGPHRSEVANVRETLDARVRRRLATRLDVETMGRLSIGLHTYPQPGDAEPGRPRVVDPPLYPEIRSTEASGTSYDALKRGVDVVASLTLLVMLAPLFLLIALLVKLGSRGPVFFRQVRVGRQMKPFTILKFRTMYFNVDHGVHQDFVNRFINASGQPESGQPRTFKLTNDPRVSAVGRILRKTSLDELPQFWNVLRGEMSLVGPRPPIPYEVEQYKPWHCRRVLEAKPGITGLWQVSGRSRTTFDDMVRLDLRYARTCSLWTDLKILVATPAAVIAGKGAC